MTDEEVRLPLLHSQALADSLVKITRVPDRLGDLEGSVLQDMMWNETTDRKPPDPVFQRRTDFYADPREMILQGPIFGLSNPWAKCPRPNCRSSNDNDVIDLTVIPDDYLPRVNYTPGRHILFHKKPLRICSPAVSKFISCGHNRKKT